MEIANLFIVLVVALVGLGAGGVGAWALARHQRRRDEASTAQAVEAAVDAVLAERSATAAAVTADRERTVEAAVSNAVQVAGVALDAKLAASSSELDLRSRSFDQRAAAIDEQLARLGSSVEALHRNHESRLHALTTELRSAGEQRQALHQTAQQLRDALANPKRRGQWGERMAEDVLRAAGFTEGVNYRRQTQDEGGGIPDITFLLPGDLVLNMDVKFPVDNYLRFLEAEDDGARDGARRQFSRDVRARVREIADRGYIDPDRTVDIVLLFIPNEAVYAFLHENDPDLVDQALGQKVVLCSPFTLFAVLAVVRQSVDQFRLERTSSEILVELTKVRAEWAKFSDQVTKVGKHLSTLNNSYGELSGTRTNVMNRAFDRIDRLEEAGADGTDPDEADAADQATPVSIGDEWGTGPDDKRPPLREVG